MDIFDKINQRSSIISGLSTITVEVLFKEVKNRQLSFDRHTHIALIEEAICRQYPSAIGYKIKESGYEGVLGDRILMKE